jgi:hypothetical protein
MKYEKTKTEGSESYLVHSDCLFLLNLIMYAATINPARMETSMKKVPSSLTVPFGKIAKNIDKRSIIFETWIIN